MYYTYKFVINPYLSKYILVQNKNVLYFYLITKKNFEIYKNRLLFEPNIIGYINFKKKTDFEITGDTVDIFNKNYAIKKNSIKVIGYISVGNNNYIGIEPTNYYISKHIKILF